MIRIPEPLRKTRAEMSWDPTILEIRTFPSLGLDLCTAWLTHMCDMTHSYMWHDAYNRTHTHTHTRTCMCACMHTHTQMYIHVYTHIYHEYTLRERRVSKEKSLLKQIIFFPGRNVSYKKPDFVCNCRTQWEKAEKAEHWEAIILVIVIEGVFSLEGDGRPCITHCWNLSRSTDSNHPHVIWRWTR